MTNSKTTQSKDKNHQDSGNTSNRGFASMPHEKVQEIASKGGHASAEKAGHEGMAERGHKGGEARAEQTSQGSRSSRSSQQDEDEEDFDDEDNEMEAQDDQDEKGDRRQGKSRSGRGFASQPTEKVREAGKKGGEHSHGGRASAH